MLTENKYQQHLKQEIESMFPGCIILKNDPNYLQGIPDLQINYKGKTAWLEVKKSEDAPHRPNQDHYVKTFSDWGVFSAFIYPENEKEILDGLQQSLEPRRKARLSKR